jgi:hypothetical protein
VRERRVGEFALRAGQPPPEQPPTERLAALGEQAVQVARRDADVRGDLPRVEVGIAEAALACAHRGVEVRARPGAQRPRGARARGEADEPGEVFGDRGRGRLGQRPRAAGARPERGRGQRADTVAAGHADRGRRRRGRQVGEEHRVGHVHRDLTEPAGERELVGTEGVEEGEVARAQVRLAAALADDAVAGELGDDEEQGLRRRGDAVLGAQDDLRLRRDDGHRRRAERV